MAELCLISLMPGSFTGNTEKNFSKRKPHQNGLLRDDPINDRHKFRVGHTLDLDTNSDLDKHQEVETHPDLHTQIHVRSFMSQRPYPL